jgi:hypothetical protein
MEFWLINLKHMDERTAPNLHTEIQIGNTHQSKLICV